MAQSIDTMKQPKDYDPALWGRFVEFVKDRDVEIGDHGILFLMWEAWYDGYSFKIPTESEINTQCKGCGKWMTEEKALTHKCPTL